MKNFLIYSLLSIIFLLFSGKYTYAQTSVGHALQFYGSTPDGKGVLKIPIDNPETKANIGATDITIEWWMKANPGDNISQTCDTIRDSWKQGNIIFDRSIEGIADYGSYGVSISDGVISFGIASGNQVFTLCGNTRVDDGKWHHIALTRNKDGSMFIFVDGMIDTQYQGPQGSIAYHAGRTTTIISDPFLIIGGKKNQSGEGGAPSFVGMIDELRISNVQRYNDAFLPPTSQYTPDNNTILLYHFEDCTDTEVLDSAANPLNPTIDVGGNPSGPAHIESNAPILIINNPNICVIPTSAPVCPMKNKGDSNCDSQVNLQDFEVWRKEFTGASSTQNSDFTVDKQISLSDFEIWRKNYLNEF